MPRRPTWTVVPESRRRKLLASARAAATEVGEAVLSAFRGVPRTDVAQKGEGDFVTAVDLRSERQLARRLLAEFPDHGFLGEESGVLRADAEFVWVVDPIDGTSNFAQGLPHFAISVACLRDGMPIAAAAYCAPERVVYSAAAGLGSRRGNRRLRTPPARLDAGAVVGAQWFRGVWEPELLEPLIRSGVRLRTLGSSVTQLCDVALGRLHANVQTQGRVWDIAAAGLIVAEAGARFTDHAGRKIFPFDDPFAERHYPSLAAPAPLHAALRRLLARAIVPRA